MSRSRQAKRRSSGQQPAKLAHVSHRGRSSLLVRELAAPSELDDPGQASPSPSPGFEPSANQLKYLFALRAAATEGENTSDAEMQRVTRISRTTIWEWKHDANFRRWLGEAMRTEHDHDFELAVARHSRLAIQGSVRSFEAIARVRSIGLKGGGFTPEALAGGDNRTYQFNVLVPRPLADGGEA